MQKSDPVYKPENVPLFETIYGENLISLGGFAAIDNMFSDLNIRGLNALDIGFGLGGVAFYLAKKYQMSIAGVEIHDWMVKYAKAQTPKDIAPLVKFATYSETGEIPFEAKSFDLIYSKGVLNHVRDKRELFKQINKMLKINGLFVIADWIYPKAIQENSSPLVYETRESYLQILQEMGFYDVAFRDDSMIFLGYVEELLKNIVIKRKYIEQSYSSEIFSIIWNDHQKLMDDIKHKQKCAIRIIAKKIN